MWNMWGEGLEDGGMLGKAGEDSWGGGGVNRDRWGFLLCTVLTMSISLPPTFVVSLLLIDCAAGSCMP